MPEGEKGQDKQRGRHSGCRISCSCRKALLSCEEKQRVRGHLAGGRRRVHWPQVSHGSFCMGGLPVPSLICIGFCSSSPCVRSSCRGLRVNYGA